MKTNKIAFIGCGNMAKSLIGGLLANDFNVHDIIASDPNIEQRKSLSDELKIHTVATNNEVVEIANVVILAVKPQVMKQVVSELADAIKQKDKLIISIAAGIRLESLESWLQSREAIVRVMPNTPALIQAGIAGMYASAKTNDEQKRLAKYIMSSVGSAVWLKDEKQIDSVTALSGSGPAYFFYFMEAMENAALELGLSSEIARKLTLETALGAAKMAVSSTQTPAELRQNVTSPGGTTEQAITIFQNEKLDEIVKQAMQAAKQRSIELSEEAGS